MQTIKLLTTASSSSNAVATVTLTKRCKLKCMIFDMSMTGGAGVARMSFEISRQNTSNLSTAGVVTDVALASASLAVGNALTAANTVVIPHDVDLEAGTILNLNTFFSGAAAPTTQVNVYIITT